jgi:hypothetical protein
MAQKNGRLTLTVNVTIQKRPVEEMNVLIRRAARKPSHSKCEMLVISQRFVDSMTAHPIHRNTFSTPISSALRLDSRAPQILGQPMQAIARGVQSDWKMLAHIMRA